MMMWKVRKQNIINLQSFQFFEATAGLWNFLRVIRQLYGEGNGTPLQYSCLENPMDGGAWWAAVHGVEKSRTRLSDFTFTFHFHALQKEMATHSSVLAWRIPGTGGAWWAAVYGVAQSRTRLKRLSSSSSSSSRRLKVINCSCIHIESLISLHYFFFIGQLWIKCYFTLH